MSEPLTRVLLLAAVWAAVVVVLAWGRLPPRARQVLALATSAGGVFSLVTALVTEGRREASATGSFLLGTPYQVEAAAASASLPYYVLTALCLLLGTVGLALPDRVAARQRRHVLATAVVLGVLITALRFALEKAAAPAAWTWAAGVTSLPPLVGAVFAWTLEANRPLRPLVAPLLVYGLGVRGGVALMYVLATTWNLGSHYDLSLAEISLANPFTGRKAELEPGSVAQLTSVVLLPQLLVWPVYTLLGGLLGAAAVRLLGRARSGAGVPAQTGA